MKKSAIRQQTFAREYVVDLNATRAAIAAGYSENGARVRGSELLENRNVRKLVDELLSERATRLGLKADQVVEEIRRLAFSNMLDYMRIENGVAKIDLSHLTRDQAAAIQ